MKNDHNSRDGVVGRPATAGTRREFLGKVTRSIIGGGILVGGVMGPRTALADCNGQQT